MAKKIKNINDGIIKLLLNTKNTTDIEVILKKKKVNQVNDPT